MKESLRSDQHKLAVSIQQAVTGAQDAIDRDDDIGINSWCTAIHAATAALSASTVLDIRNRGEVARFEIVTCTNGHVKFVDLPGGPSEFSYDAGDRVYANLGCVLDAGGVKQHKCGSCYDSAYAARFVGFFTDEGN